MLCWDRTTLCWDRPVLSTKLPKPKVSIWSTAKQLCCVWGMGLWYHDPKHGAESECSLVTACRGSAIMTGSKMVSNWFHISTHACSQILISASHINLYRSKFKTKLDIKFCCRGHIWLHSAYHVSLSSRGCPQAPIQGSNGPLIPYRYELSSLSGLCMGKAWLT